jgi:hypothetical protein
MYFVDPDGMQADDWKRDINGKMVHDKNLNNFNKSYTLGIGEQWVGSSHFEPTGNNKGLNYNEDGTIDNLIILDEVVVNSSRSTNITTDGLRFFGFGGDAIAGSGNMKQDRGSGSIQADMPGDVGMLYEFGQMIGDGLNWLIDNDKPTSIVTQSSSSPKVDTPEPISQDTTISIVEKHYTVNTYYNGKSKTVPRVSFSKDTTIQKKDVKKVIENNDKKNKLNYKNEK